MAIPVLKKVGGTFTKNLLHARKRKMSGSAETLSYHFHGIVSGHSTWLSIAATVTTQMLE